MLHHLTQLSVVGARAGMAAAAVLCLVGLAVDITSIVYNSRQIHIYRKQQKAKVQIMPLTSADAVLNKISF